MENNEYVLKTAQLLTDLEYNNIKLEVELNEQKEKLEELKEIIQQYFKND